MNEEKDTTLPPTDEAHWQAYWKIDNYDREYGRLCFWHYALDYYKIIQEPHPNTPLELLAYLDGCPTIGQSRDYMQLKQLFLDISVTMPTGIEDLPECWLCGFHRFIIEMLWVDRDAERVRCFFDWSLVLRQGPCLEIHYGKEIPRFDPYWPIRANLLFEFHKFLEPGPFTSASRLEEFT